MKNLFLITIVFFLALSFLSTSAKIWVVDSNPGNLAKDFATLQTAHDDASVLIGDTLYLSGSAIGYGNLTATKTLHIFGPGYFLNENDSTQANVNEAIVGKIIFQSGSDGSSILGCSINYSATATIEIYANNIKFKRNKIHRGDWDYAVVISNGRSNILFIQNYIDCDRYIISIQQYASNIIFSNNFIQSTINYAIISSHSTCENIVLENNIFYGDLSLSNASIINNILRSGSYSGTNNNIQYNICNSTQFPNDGTNQVNVNMGTVFLGNGSTDGQWQLAPGSPAIGTGSNGTDIGMFGGDNPYTLSGIPPIPAIYEFLGSSTGSQFLPVQAKIKSRN